MDALQFSLCFAALLLGYVMVHVRLVRFETYLKEIAGIKTLNERLKAVSDSVERVRLDRVEELLQLLHEDLEDLRASSGRVERAVVSRSGGMVPGSGGERSAAERIRSVVETRLLDLGYNNLHLLTDLTKATLEEQVEVQVECERDHMPCKGKVSTRNGAVVEVQITSASQSFP